LLASVIRKRDSSVGIGSRLRNGRITRLAEVTHKIDEMPAVSAAEFAATVQGRSRPVVLRGQMADWPAVQLARQSPRALFESLAGLDDGQLVNTMVGAPEIRGRFFYTPGVDGVNFERRPQRLRESIAQILAAAESDSPPTIYVGAMPLQGHRAEFSRQNSLDLLPASVLPRLWLGNAATVQTHLDMSENLAGVVCGTRRFTLFPPQQVGNLYVGPLDFTLAGQPVSMVQLDEPDFARYPKFREALAAGCTADLEPGDALYIPYMWWHHVRMTGPFNVLVNFWWARGTAWSGSPFDCLVHGIAALRALPEPERSAWRAIFNHFIFDDVEGSAHIPAEQRGVLTPLSPEIAEKVRQWLLQSLKQR